MAKNQNNRTPERIKVGSVSLTIYPETRPDRGGKEYWKAIYYNQDGKRRYLTRSSKAALKEAARDKAREIHNQATDFTNLPAEKIRLVEAFLRLDPTWDDLRELEEKRNLSQKTVEELFPIFIAAKEQSAGNSPHHVNTLRSRLKSLVSHFEGKPIARLQAAELDTWLQSMAWSPTTKKKTIGAAVSFFAWAQAQGFIKDGKTAAQKMAVPIVPNKTPSTYTPEEYHLMLANVQPQYLLWLALAGMAGIRREELYPNKKSQKQALQWEHFDFKKRIISLPPEVSKTGRRRPIPLCDALLAICEQHAKSSGRVCSGRAPEMPIRRVIETKRLGDLIGGWKPNALRHSFVSYRCALVGPGQTANEAGNSEAMTRSAYLDLKTKEAASKWFAPPLPTLS